MSVNSPRQNYETFKEWRQWAIAKKILKIKKKKRNPMANLYTKDFY
jgi:hypothetical protein